ncbi:uncharacterized protein MYCFIDRAFT_201639 [Pseudocercospora fijiensis CIRAD86]|uniref:F-box domain-containing protein n=1 Tax=Pseudocercospora fijiensis (strain CIRAD86) TaxID=383855 RepID=N1QAA2_PSEFD|nr:uncharacterized protein MYCFIDRAFT_201639 [Pseudocercospora fijiensis CIRAD86]EME88721.1 hypothetical protein MYCFIDRAFT_201639 [Pseudocercospora fijiensis CIRAD86]
MANAEEDIRLPVTLLDLLSISLVLRQTAPYLSVKELRRLSLTSQKLRSLIYGESEAWSHLNLVGVKRAIIETAPIDVGGISWRAERMDESLTEDDFYAGPLRGILGSLHSKQVLKFVQTLILDGLTVPADLVREMLAEDRYHVRVLSLREARQLNVTKLQQILRYSVRPTRDVTSPRLKALYIFGPKDASRFVVPSNFKLESAPSLGVMGSGTQLGGAQIGADWNARSSNDMQAYLADDERKWYGCNGRVIKRPFSEWAETLQVCKGIINFDAVLCRGPRHDITKVASKDFLQPTIATIALGPAGCETCHSCPEQPALFGESAEHTLPLLAPIPLHSSTVRAAIRPEQQPDGSFPSLILRCEDCLRGRWCEQCNRWWCEGCYQEPVSRATLRTELQQAEMREDLQRDGWASVTNAPAGNQAGVHRDCYLCGRTCQACKDSFIRTCRSCKQEYCFPHDENCTEAKIAPRPANNSYKSDDVAWRTYQRSFATPMSFPL